MNQQLARRGMFATFVGRFIQSTALFTAEEVGHDNSPKDDVEYAIEFCSKYYGFLTTLSPEERQNAIARVLESFASQVGIPMKQQMNVLRLLQESLFGLSDGRQNSVHHLNQMIIH